VKNAYKKSSHSGTIHIIVARWACFESSWQDGHVLNHRGMISLHRGTMGACDLLQILSFDRGMICTILGMTE
jgi:hypothetical protein